MNVEKDLERFRYAVFIGNMPDDNFTPLSQEEYVDQYEQQLERDPARERKLLEDLSASLLPLYRSKLEQIAKIEQTISGIEEPISFSDAFVLEELYDEISNLETEEEWIEFKKRLTQK